MAGTQARVATRPLSPHVGAEVLGVDLASGVDDDSFRAIRAAFLAHQVLLFDARDLPSARQVEFARRFGEVQIHVMNQYHADGYPELYRLSNLDADGRPNGRHPDRGTMSWHTDGSWQRVTGQATILYAEVASAEGGETHFCDMYGAYDRLSPAWKARLAGMRAIHNLDFSRTRRHGDDPLTDEQRRARPPVDHPIVRTHAESGRRCVFLGDHAESIVGMPYDAGRALIEELNALIVHDDLTYRHRWSAGQLIAWDNRCVLHRATPYDPAVQRRVIRRCTVLGEVPQ
ncbi:MAG TPA: TauD/TfdA family dioxygenase [Casimicrobiaceae bacterium]|nr:TauD/TfdA family dioxygenase [Casimicrobiaceae bacterium]